MTDINNVSSSGALARLDHQAGLVGTATKRLPAALEQAGGALYIAGCKGDSKEGDRQERPTQYD